MTKTINADKLLAELQIMFNKIEAASFLGRMSDVPYYNSQMEILYLFREAIQNSVEEDKDMAVKKCRLEWPIYEISVEDFEKIKIKSFLGVPVCYVNKDGTGIIWPALSDKFELFVRQKDVA